MGNHHLGVTFFSDTPATAIRRFGYLILSVADSVCASLRTKQDLEPPCCPFCVRPTKLFEVFSPPAAWLRSISFRLQKIRFRKKAASGLPTMLDNLGNRFIFPAPQPSYGAQSYKRNLCWIPWNSVISPKRMGDEQSASGIPCLWFPAPKAATVILFFHANAEDLGMSFAVLRHIRDQFKVNVLAVEYPGYGLLHHMEPSEDAVYEVALTAFRFLVDEIGVRYSQIILFGRSLGSGPAVFLAAQYPVGGLILVSAFSSIKALAVRNLKPPSVSRLLGIYFKSSGWLLFEASRQKGIGCSKYQTLTSKGAPKLGGSQPSP